MPTRTPTDARIGHNLHVHRLRLHLTQAQLARLLHVSRPTVTAIERGTRPLRLVECLQLHDALGLTIPDLIRPR